MKAKNNLMISGNVFSYNNDAFRRTTYECVAGNRLEWKRNGQRGGIRAEIIGWDVQRPDHVFVQNYSYDWTEKNARVWIKKRSVLRVL